MNIILIRHGETEANVREGARPVLTSKGKKQISKLAERLKDFEVDIIFSSNLERARITAKEIQKINKNAKLIETEELREIYRLIIGGKPKEGTRENRFEEDLKRAEDFWEKMINWNYQNVAVVCHGNIIRFFLSKALQVSPEESPNLEIEPTSVSIINVSEDKVKVSLVNDMAHIPRELLSNKQIYVE